MVDLVNIAVNTLALALVPLCAWLSQRWTREARLALRVSRLGQLLALVPESTQRTVLEGHVLAATDELNEWLDPINKGVRATQTGISIALFVPGLALVAWIQQSVSLDPALSLAAAATVGTIIGIASVGVGIALQKVFMNRQENENQAERLRKLRAGEKLTQTEFKRAR